MLIALVGCGTTIQRIDIAEPLNVNDGFVMMSIHCDAPTSWVTAYKSGDSRGWHNAALQVSCGDVAIAGNRNVVKLFSLPAGTYNIGSFVTGPNDMMSPKTKETFDFKVEPGVINYIGRVEVKAEVKNIKYVDTFGNDRVTVGNVFDVSLIDNEDKDKADLSLAYPNIFNVKEYSKRLATPNKS